MSPPPASRASPLPPTPSAATDEPASPGRATRAAGRAAGSTAGLPLWAPRPTSGGAPAALPGATQPGPDGADERVQVEGVVRRVVFAAPDGEFAVLQLDVTGKPAPVTAVGTLGGIGEGETVRIQGVWEQHPQYGRRLRAELALPVSPRTLVGLTRYLATLSGLGPELARRIVDKLGLDALELLEQETFRIAEIKGVGRRRAQRALADARTRREEREVMVFLQGLGVSATYATRIRKRYGAAAISKVKESPYALARDVSGIGFHIADRIARAVGIDPLSRERCAAGLRHVLQLASEAGHCYLPPAELLNRAGQLLRIEESESEPAPAVSVPAPAPELALPAPAVPTVREIPPELLEAALLDLLMVSEIHREGDAVYLRRMFEAEQELARLVERLVKARRRKVPKLDLSGGPLKLAPGQATALHKVEDTAVSIITGGPGTGKTTIIRALVQAFESAGLRIKLVAPTGRAAKRLSEATGHGASTVHRLLYLKPGEDQASRDLELAADLLVCDEASMLDLMLSVSLLTAVQPGTTVVFVGDVDQLPSVGPGRVLGDLIDSGRVPYTRLTDIFRQAEGSGIVDNAHRIRQGQLPLAGPRSPAGPASPGGPGSPGKPGNPGTPGNKDGADLRDFYLIEASEPLQARDLIVRLVSERIPQRFGLDPVADVQVLTPMHRGEVGTEELNKALQAVLNPRAATEPSREDGAFLRAKNRVYTLGDKVMQVKNDYERDVWNGDVGRVVAVDPEEGTLTVRFDDDREARYDTEALEQLELAYAVSVHKSQGSEYQAVVVPLMLQHYPLLRRNLLYTAVTRGKKLVVLVANSRALRRAVSEVGDLQRYTRLGLRLRDILPAE
jgi:exodeoxyribonuclease V alpha subunit